MKINRFNKILIANRGEIALRIIRTVRSMGRRAVVVYSFSDRELPFVTEADEAYSLGSGTLAETYLDQSKIIRIAREVGADAIHPGYGFLAENAGFAALCKKEKIAFIGPDPEAIRIMGDKVRARERAGELGLPLLDGFAGEPDELVASADRFPYPVLIKPSAGGGGKGMRIVHSAEMFEEAALEASREAVTYFGSGDLYVEQLLVNPRHIEVQVMADHHGNAVHLFERECSIQRRYQKIIEEAPSVSVSPATRRLITERALDLVRGMGYTNAGTVEFLMDETGSFYFLEMNTRIQVEHPVTEMITGIDLVKEQITIAEGESLSFSQDDLQISGHAIEARIYAEDPNHSFMPSAGKIGAFMHPDTRGPRIDSGYRRGNRVESHYDPMIAKVIAHGTDRKDAIRHLVESLKNFHITGLNTNRDYLVSLLQIPFFARNRLHTMIVEQEAASILEAVRQTREKINPKYLVTAATLICLQRETTDSLSHLSPWQVIGHWRLIPEIVLLYDGKEYRVKYELIGGRNKMMLQLGEERYEVTLVNRDQESYRIRIDNQLFHLWAITDHSEVHLDLDGHHYTLRRPDLPDERYISRSAEKSIRMSDRIVAPLNGRIIRINSREGDEVHKSESLLVIESMKMENKILAPHRSVIKKCHVSVGDQVHNNQILFTLGTYDRSTDQ
jgi:3-methylcrotonyl-CoA carboxylase alpha subunit